MRFIVTGGGTGGHIYPALAIAGGLKERFGAEVFYIGGTRGLESGIVPREGLPFRAIPLAGFRRGLSPSNLAAAWKAATGVNKARRLIKEIRPAAVIGTGGYVCGPVVLAAALSGIPTMIHEQNAYPGITNRILSRFVRCVALTFGEARKFLPAGARVKITGLPIRKEMLTREREEGRQRLGLPPDGLLVLSFGGSQGARSINNAMIHVLKRFAGRRGIHFLHVTGPANYGRFMEEIGRGMNVPESGNITINSYMHDMPSALAAADLVISRAGAATLAEITAVGLPAILVPYPHAAENHQEHNARALERRKAAVVIRDRDLTGVLLAAELERITGQPELLEEMARASRELGKPGALGDILDCVQDILDNNPK
ncbi:MAG: undecaprenyldiphospho-muramoylpentapeptide beta-N-acetylglucosaminyltransferase [Peptococcaceae bacterium]|nr:undecaprenyldiphospho-muramoylpentapeptide beta-N-acetylglucosaminyltransferase [Peptococcaceae bacterium]